MVMLLLKNETKIFLYKRYLFFVGLSTLAVLDTSFFLTKNSILVKKNFVEVSFSLSNQFLFDVIFLKIKNILDSVNFVYKKKILLFGVGFRCWVSKMNNSEFIIFKIGTSQDISIQLPKGISVIILKPTLLMFKSLNNIKLSQFMSLIYSLKPADSYKGKGFKYLFQDLRLKPGKRN